VTAEAAAGIARCGTGAVLVHRLGFRQSAGSHLPKIRVATVSATIAATNRPTKIAAAVPTRTARPAPLHAVDR
jgi:hypothetical protein